MHRDDMAQRLKRRREEKRMTVRELARVVGVSPAYISIIENGQKVPTQELAERLADALDESPRLYAAWARATRESTLVGASRAIREYETQLRTPNLDVAVVTPDEVQVELIMDGDVERSPALATAQRPGSGLRPWSLFRKRHVGKAHVDFLQIEGGDSEIDDSAALVELSSRDSSRDALLSARGASKARQSAERYHIPLFAEGCNPSDAACDIAGVVRVARSTVPAKERKCLKDAYAYRVSEQSIERVRDVLQPGDMVVISSTRLFGNRRDIYAVYLGGRIILSRILRKGRVILVLSSRGNEDIEVLDGDDAEKKIIGRVAIVIRTWHYGVFSPSQSS